MSSFEILNLSKKAEGFKFKKLRVEVFGKICYDADKIM